jgi:hypothetical protein
MLPATDPALLSHPELYTVEQKEMMLDEKIKI